MQKFQVALTAEDRQALLDLIRTGKAAARKPVHARILLEADASDDRLHRPDCRIAIALEMNVATVERVRRHFVERGFEASLHRELQEKPSRPIKLAGRAEARLIALACSPPPVGRASWTMQPLADKLVELQVVGSISDETVRVPLEKPER